MNELMNRLIILKTLTVLIFLVSCTKKEQRVFIDERDGRVYQIIEIDGQTWMAENLAFEIESSWCYDDNLYDCDKNGRLYTWYDACKVCPSGWRLSSDSDWLKLESFIGISEIELLNEKFRGTTQGERLRIGGDLRFNATISGYRRPNGTYDRRGQRSAFWLSTETSLKSALHRDIRADTGAIYRSSVPKFYALSVRCIKQ